VEIPLLSAQQIATTLKRSVEDPSSAIQIVCFDYFDTLVRRSVLPEDTKKIAAHQLADLLGGNITGDLIYKLRQVLESRLCAENHQKGLDPEFNLSHLAEKLYGVLRGIIGEGLRLSEDSFMAIMASIELAVEKQVQSVNREVVAILRNCRDRGLRTAIVSDFYLPAEYFQQLLLFHGLAEWVEKLFISADYALTKGHSGRLYDVVGRELCCVPEAMVMVGDNVRADGTMARDRGLTSYCLRQPEKTTESMIKHIRGKSEGAPTSVYATVLAGQKAKSFPEMGLSLHLFIHNLFLQARQDRHDTLFFCSKEGEFLQKLFMRYQEIRFGRQVIASRYLLVSRKATFICSCKDLDAEDFSRLFVHYRDLSLLEFLQSLNFSEAESLALCEKLQLEPGTRHHNLKNHTDFQALLHSAVFRSHYEIHRLNQRENFLSYLHSYGKDFPKEGLTLVDVGWKGSIQNNIFFAFDCRVKVCGYYIGLLSPTELHENNQKKGILFSDVPTHSPFIHVYNNNRSLFEMVLGASHGSADGYYSQDQWNNLSYPRPSSFFQGEYPFVTVLDLPEERKLYNELIAPLQKVYHALHEALTKQLVSLVPSLPSPEWWAKQHARMVFNPTKDEIDFYAGLYHLENFGLFQFTAFQQGRKLPISTRLRNLITLIKDPSGHLETGVWPPIILRRLDLDFLTWIEGKKRFKTVFGTYR
jgi:FMN phosphatase YigB (HAD superfamily)